MLSSWAVDFKNDSNKKKEDLPVVGKALYPKVSSIVSWSPSSDLCSIIDQQGNLAHPWITIKTNYLSLGLYQCVFWIALCVLIDWVISWSRHCQGDIYNTMSHIFVYWLFIPVVFVCTRLVTSQSDSES